MANSSMMDPHINITEPSKDCLDIVEPVLKNTSIKRPPLHNDHSQICPSNI